MTDKEKLRIQFNDFKREHFDISPIWEFAIDEEGEEGQDETTLKPRPDIFFPDPSAGLLIIECEFESNSGKRFIGLCSPSFNNSLSSIQPYIFTDHEMIMFWFGISRPEDETKRNIYSKLGETPGGLFPLKFKSKLSNSLGLKIEGVINGFMWMSFSDQSVTIER